MLTERETASAIPPSGFIRDYCIHSVRQTTSPLCYHLATGLSILATTCPLNYGANYAGRLRANLYSLLVGRSGEDQKSTAVNIGRDVLFAAAPSLIGDFPGSQEGLIDSLSRNPSQMIPMSEFGRFLASAQRGYFEPVKTLLTDLWDALPIQRAKANGRVIRVDDPRLTVLAACAIPYLEKHTLAEDWSGGFMGRWAVMYGRRERTNANPVGDNRMFDALVEALRVRGSTPTAGWCTGLEPDAEKYWNDWFMDVSNRYIPGQIVGVGSRAPTIARKASLLYSWDFGPALEGQPWRMDRSIVEYGIRFAELHIKSIIGLSGAIAEHPDARLRRSVLRTMEKFGGTSTLGQILSVLHMKKRPVVEILDALLEEGRVTKVTTMKGYAFALQATVLERCTG